MRLGGWFAPRCNPIGIDFGRSSLRLAQVSIQHGRAQLIAAASAEVPADVRKDPALASDFFHTSVKDMLAKGNFRGRHAVLAAPAASMIFQHLILPHTDENTLKQSIAWEVAEKTGVAPSQLMLRHTVVGSIHRNDEQRDEVLVMAIRRDAVQQLLAAATRAKLLVRGMTPEPLATLDCFARGSKPSGDATLKLYVDIGFGATRVYIAREKKLCFARSIPIGSGHLDRAVAAEFAVSAAQGRAMRAEWGSGLQVSHPMKQMAIAGSTSTSDYGSDSSFAAPTYADRVELSCQDIVDQLAREIELCRNYHETRFHDDRVGRLVFIGGESFNRRLCRRMAEAIHLPASQGNPISGMLVHDDATGETGLDTTKPQPAWTVAIGVSLGGAASSVAIA